VHGELIASAGGDDVSPSERAIRTILGERQMAKKSKITSSQAIQGGNLASGVPTDGGIPDFLKRQPDDKKVRDEDDKPLAPTPAAPAAPPAKRKPAHVPMGMTEEEYDAKAKELGVKANGTEKAEKPEKVVKEKKAKKPDAPHGTFKLADWARKNDLDPRLVRRLARANAAAFKALQVSPAHKYVYETEKASALLALVNEGKANDTKKKVKVEKAPSKKIAPGGVFTGKAKKKPAASAPVETNAKADARADAEKAIVKAAKEIKAKKAK
jgi:hypothetical protein